MAPKRFITLHIEVNASREIGTHEVKLYDKDGDECRVVPAAEFFPTLSCRFEVNEFSLKIEGTKDNDTIYNVLKEKLEFCIKIEHVIVDLKSNLWEIDFSRLLACSLSDVKSLSVKYREGMVFCDPTDHFLKLFSQLQALERVCVNVPLDSKVLDEFQKRDALTTCQCVVSNASSAQVAAFVNHLALAHKQFSFFKILHKNAFLDFVKRPEHLTGITAATKATKISIKSDTGANMEFLVVPDDPKTPRWVLLLRVHDYNRFSIDMAELHESILLRMITKEALNHNLKATQFAPLRSLWCTRVDRDDSLKLDLCVDIGKSVTVINELLKTKINTSLQAAFPEAAITVNKIKAVTHV